MVQANSKKLFHYINYKIPVLKIPTKFIITGEKKTVENVGAAG